MKKRKHNEGWPVVGPSRMRWLFWITTRRTFWGDVYEWSVWLFGIRLWRRNYEWERDLI